MLTAIKNLKKGNITFYSLVFIFSLTILYLNIWWTQENVTFANYASSLHFHNLIKFNYLLKHHFPFPANLQFLNAHHPPLMHFITFITTTILSFKYYLLPAAITLIICFYTYSILIKNFIPEHFYLATINIFLLFLHPYFMHLIMSYNLEVLVILFVAIYYYVIFLKKNYKYLGLIIGFGLLTKSAFIFFIIGDVCVILYAAVKRKNMYIIYQLLFALTICAWWYIIKFYDFCFNIKFNLLYQLLDSDYKNTSINFIKNILFYPETIIQNLSLPIIIIFFISLLLNFKQQKRLFISYFFIPILILSIIGIAGTKKYFYLLPLYPIFLISPYILIQKLKSKTFQFLFFMLLILLQIHNLIKQPSFFPYPQNNYFKGSLFFDKIKDNIDLGQNIGLYSFDIDTEAYFALLLFKDPNIYESIKKHQIEYIFLEKNSSLSENLSKISICYIFISLKPETIHSELLLQELTRKNFSLIQKQLLSELNCQILYYEKTDIPSKNIISL